MRYNNKKYGSERIYPLFKTTLSKYLTAFVAIILVSFVMVSSIITFTIKGYAQEQNSKALRNSSESVSLICSNIKVQTQISSGHLVDYVRVLLSHDTGLNIVIIDNEGRILLRANMDGGTERIVHSLSGSLGSVETEAFSNLPEGKVMEYTGVIGGASRERIQSCIAPLYTAGEKSGYIISFVSTEKEDNLVAMARKATVNSSLWVMLAAVVAVYFITERIVHPLKNMTVAAKSFAKGDFSARVTVYGKDEVAELSEAFNNMAENLDNFEKMRNSFLANVSHDLRTPMTTIAGLIEGINSGAIPEDKRAYYLGVISDEVHRLSRLVTELLDISRLESGERKFNPESFDVSEMARVVLISFEQSIEKKKLDVSFESDEDEMMVFADKDAVHQVLYNLCHNAVKFSKEGGKLTVSISRYESKKIRVSVYDEGQGIPKEDLPFVFERFYKSDKSRGLDKSGVGLGLYICRTIIESHSETIRVESPSENSTEFWFTLKEGETHNKKRG